MRASGGKVIDHYLGIAWAVRVIETLTLLIRQKILYKKTYPFSDNTFNFITLLSAIAIEQIHVIVIGFVILFTIRTRLAQDNITLFRTDSREIIYPV